MSLRDSMSAKSALQNVSAHVEEAIRERQSGRTLSSIGSGGSHSSGGLYIEVPGKIATAVYHHTSGGTLTSTRLQGPREAPAADAAGLVGGVRIEVSGCQPVIGSTSSASCGREVIVVSRQRW